MSPTDPLIQELREIFASWRRTESRFLDLPRATIVPELPDDRPEDDFVTIPPTSEDEALEDLRDFLAERDGDATNGVIDIEQLESIVSERGLTEEFRDFRMGRARSRARAWLTEHGVIYT